MSTSLPHTEQQAVKGLSGNFHFQLGRHTRVRDKDQHAHVAVKAVGGETTPPLLDPENEISRSANMHLCNWLIIIGACRAVFKGERRGASPPPPHPLTFLNQHMELSPRSPSFFKTQNSPSAALGKISACSPECRLLNYRGLQTG